MINNSYKNSNEKNSITNKKIGGPYTQKQRLDRQNEVYRLHFEYGYSASKIADLMKINRNTINDDIRYWYSETLQSGSIINPERVIILHLQRLEVQRSRLREKLDKTESFQESIALERLIYEIDSKILQTSHRLSESYGRLMDKATDRLNNWLKENNKPERYMRLFDKITVSKEAREKINKIIEEDKIR